MFIAQAVAFMRVGLEQVKAMAIKPDYTYMCSKPDKSVVILNN
jgi:hypothetical protein